MFTEKFGDSSRSHLRTHLRTHLKYVHRMSVISLMVAQPAGDRRVIFLRKHQRCCTLTLMIILPPSDWIYLPQSFNVSFQAFATPFA